MKKFLFLSAAVVLCSCGAKSKKTDAWQMDLKGEVKHVEQRDFLVLETNGKELEIKENEASTQNFDADFLNNGLFREINIFGPKGKVFKKVLYNYDANSWLTAMRSFDETGKEVVTLKIKNDANGNAVEKILSSIDTTLQETLRYVHRYDKEGNEIEMTTYRGNKIIFHSKSKYDSKGNRVQSEEIDPGSNKIKKTVSYTYNSNGKKLSEKVVDDKGKLLSSSVMKYDANDHIISEVFKIDMENYKHLETRTYTYKLDAKGNWISRTTYGNGEPKKVVQRKITYY